RDGNDEDSVSSTSGGGDSARFDGVTNVTDESSPDPWAAKVGWWEAEVDERDVCFGLLTDALRARDSEQIRRDGANVARASLGIPGDYDRLYNDVVTIKRNATKAANEEAREASHEYQRKLNERAEQAEAETRAKFQKKCDEEVRREVSEAVSKERKEGREAQSRIRRELEEKHEREMTSLRREHEETLAQHCRAESEQVAERLKPVFDVGEEVYAAWWPAWDSKRDTNPSWYLGHVVSWKEQRGKGDYGSLRLYTVKFEDDGSTLKRIPEHFVSSRRDYELHIEKDDDPTSDTWTGVRNVLDKNSEDDWARFVGYYVATVDGGAGEERYGRLHDALQAHDRAVVRRRGENTKRNELNLPGEWMWLLEDVDEEDTSSNKSARSGQNDGGRTYTRAEVDEELDVLRKELSRQQNKRQREQEKDEQDFKRVKAQHIRELSKAVENALIDAKIESDKNRAVAVRDALRKQRQELAGAHSRDKAGALEQLGDELHRIHEDELERQRSDLEAYFDLEREKALHWARVESDRMIQDRVEEELDRARTRLDEERVRVRVESELERLRPSIERQVEANTLGYVEEMVAAEVERQRLALEKDVELKVEARVRARLERLGALEDDAVVNPPPSKRARIDAHPATTVSEVETREAANDLFRLRRGSGGGYVSPTSPSSVGSTRDIDLGDLHLVAVPSLAAEQQRVVDRRDGNIAPAGPASEGKENSLPSGGPSSSLPLDLARKIACMITGKSAAPSAAHSDDKSSAPSVAHSESSPERMRMRDDAAEVLLGMAQQQGVAC
ncbi:hypothetical protein THAOC_01316, partial [Thalassiosira oceanica]